MLSATLLHQHPALPEQRLASGQASWQVPAVSIERLLQLSSTIVLSEGEMTPVQAWDALRRDERLRDLSLERLARLREKLLGAVTCYGYVCFRFLESLGDSAKLTCI
jgi:hypothetical protein